jgi:TrmH family RNA methyltransferase
MARPAAADPITSRANPLYRRLRELKRRADEDLCLLEGPKLVEEALRAGLALEECAASEKAERTPLGRHVLSELRGRAVPVRVIDDALLASLAETETSQGLVALARRPAFAEEELYPRDGPALVVLAAGVQDPGNVGALLRTAEAAGATGAYLCGTADPLGWKALRGSMGSAFRLPHVRTPADAESAAARLRARGVTLLAAVGQGGLPYERADLTRPVGLLLGNEGRGLDPALLAAADERVSIPVQAPVESLNVSAAAAVLLFEAARQRRREGKEEPR